MVPLLEEIHTEVLRRVTPSGEERKRVLELAEELEQKVRAAAEEAGVEAEVKVEGSVAKDTWLSREPDIDIFMQVPTTMPREAFGTICLEITRRAAKGFKHVEQFTEHPYLEAIINDVKVNIVPCYRVKRGKWISATDRTPFHTYYIKPFLNEQLQGEVRLLKKFIRGIGISMHAYIPG